MITPGYPRRQLPGQTLYADPQPQPRKKIGGVKAVTLMGGGSGGSIAGRGGYNNRMPAPAAAQDNGRQARIDAARADGTFADKRDKFNKGNRSAYMDETGTIGPRADSNLKGLDMQKNSMAHQQLMSDNKKIGNMTPEGGSMARPSSVKMPTVSGGGAVAMPKVNGAGNGGSVPMPQVGGSPATPAAKAPPQAAANKPATPAIGTPAAKSAGGAFTTLPKGARNLYAEEKKKESDARPLGERLRDRIATGDSAIPNTLESKALALQNAIKTAEKDSAMIASMQPPMSQNMTVAANETSAPSSANSELNRKPVTTRLNTGIAGIDNVGIGNRRQSSTTMLAEEIMPGITQSEPVNSSVREKSKKSVGLDEPIAANKPKDKQSSKAAPATPTVGTVTPMVSPRKPGPATPLENPTKPFRDNPDGGAFAFAGDVVKKLGSGFADLATSAATKAINLTQGVSDTVASTKKVAEIGGDYLAEKAAKNNPDGIIAKRAKEKERVKLAEEAKELAKNGSAREEGGPVAAGKPYLVGEKGPEIVVPKQDGTVIPNPKTIEKKRIGSKSILSGKTPRGSSMAIAGLMEWMMGK